MKIESRRLNRTSATRPKSGSAGNAAAAFNVAPTATNVGTSTPLTGLSGPSAIGAALLAQQEDTPQQRRDRTVRRADDLLDRLDEIRLSLLSGRIDLTRLQNLKNALLTKKEGVDDPKLQETLEAVDLRVAVELAKYQA